MKKVNTHGEVCPMPLVRVRRVIQESKFGDRIQVVGDHANSFLEIPMFLNSMNIEIIEKKNESGLWEIMFVLKKKTADPSAG